MKNLLTALFLFTLLRAASAESYDLGAHGQLTIDVPNTWDISARPKRDVGYDLTLHPKDKNGGLCKITIYYTRAGTKFDQAQVEAEFKQYCEKFLSISVEKTVTLKEFKLKAGYGFYATLTDGTLVGKPPSNGNWKMFSTGKIVFADEAFAGISFLSDDVNSEVHKQELEIIQSMTLQKK